MGDEYAAALPAEKWQRMLWPSQKEGRWVYVHVVSTRIKKLPGVSLPDTFKNGRMKMDQRLSPGYSL
jgi:hypothetical protein